MGYIANELGSRSPDVASSFKSPHPGAGIVAVLLTTVCFCSVLFVFHRDSEAGIEMAFLGTRAGLMRSALYVGSEKISNK